MLGGRWRRTTGTQKCRFPVWDWAPQANGVVETLAGSCREADSEPTRQQNVSTPTARMDRISRRARSRRREVRWEMLMSYCPRAQTCLGEGRLSAAFCTRSKKIVFYCRQIVGSVMVRIGFERNEPWLKKVLAIAFLSLMDRLEPIHSRRERRAR